MADVIMPEKKSASKGLFQAVGTGVGAYFGGPGGAAAGYQLGGTAADTLSPTKQPGSVKSEAIQRRIATQQPAAPEGDSQADLAAAAAATAKLPEEYQKQYMPVLQRAQQLSQAQRRAAE